MQTPPRTRSRDNELQSTPGTPVKVKRQRTPPSPSLQISIPFDNEQEQKAPFDVLFDDYDSFKCKDYRYALFRIAQMQPHEYKDMMECFENFTEDEYSLAERSELYTRIKHLNIYMTPEECPNTWIVYHVKGSLKPGIIKGSFGSMYTGNLLRIVAQHTGFDFGKLSYDKEKNVSALSYIQIKVVDEK